MRTVAPWLRATAFVSIAAFAQADVVQTTLSGSHVEEVTAGGVTLQAWQLRAGESSGAVNLNGSQPFAISAADDRNLDTYFARSGQGPYWTVDLGGSWEDPNGSGHDFFLFEVGGNDVVRVAPILPGGAIGQELTLGGWTGTGHTVAVGDNQGQEVFGLAFRAQVLLGPGGSPLGPGAELEGLRFRSDGVDVASFLFIDPNAQPPADGDRSVTVSAQRVAGQPVTLTYSGPWGIETGESPNPFLDYRLTVEFESPTGEFFHVPGYFDADGVGGDFGTVWRAKFVPDVPGQWRVRTDFRQGNFIATSLNPTAGSPGLLDGVQTQFQVQAADRSAPGFLGKGRLRYVGGHYQRWDDGSYFVKAGANSPENLLAYKGFDGVFKFGSTGNLHTYSDHQSDWAPGDPLFEGQDHGVDSRGIIGALNYLSSRGVNSVFAILMNLGGDGQDVHPFLGASGSQFDNRHYDTSRLAQWGSVFDHATRIGIGLHLAFAETEAANRTWLDNGGFGTERKLLVREMIARFGYHPCIKWNMSEENVFGVQFLRTQSEYFAALDPYRHPVTFHNYPNQFGQYSQMLGDPNLHGTSLQFDPNLAGSQVETWRTNSENAGQPWLLHMDEHTPWNVGLTNTNHDDLRKRVLWDVLLSGGGLEWYCGWHGLPLGGDLSLENFRTRDTGWRQLGHARRFFEEHLPFQNMEPMDWLLNGESSAFGGGEVFAQLGSVYAVYLPNASGNPTLNMSSASGSQVFTGRWWDPREGIFAGSSFQVNGGSTIPLGSPPYAFGEDWVLLLSIGDSLTYDVGSISASAGGTQRLFLDLGTSGANRGYQVLGTTSGLGSSFTFSGFTVPMTFDLYTRQTFQQSNSSQLVNTRGLLNGAGRSTARLTMAPGQAGPLVGQTLHHCFVLLNPVDYASNVVPLQILP